MKVREILRKKGGTTVTIVPNATLREAVAVACLHKVGALPVVNPAGYPIGILSERDILHECNRNTDLNATQVERAMTRDLILTGPDDDLVSIMNTMTNRRIRHLPVVEDRRLIGIVSIGDIVNALRDAGEVEIRFLREYIAG